MPNYRIAVIPGDGIGNEVVPEGIRVLEAAGRRFGITFTWDHFDWSCEHYAKHGCMMPDGGLEKIKKHDAIFLGAVGFPGVPDHVSLWGLLIPIRREFQQYVNLRPVRVLRGMTSPLVGRGPNDIDFYVVRENVEGEYSEIGGRMFRGTEHEAAMQESIFTRRGTDRVMRYAFELARKRTKKHVTSATKSNGIVHTMPFWDERFAAMKALYPDIRADQFHIDILTAHFVQHPDWFDVVVGSNLFGDILSDLGPAVAGSIGIAPAANINPEKEFPSMFEPVHGSAPDIAGKGIANPIGTIWCGAMMLEHLGHKDAADAVIEAIETALSDSRARTRDIGGTATTEQCGTFVAQAVAETNKTKKRLREETKGRIEMKMKHLVRAIGASALLLAAASTAQAQYPDRPVTIIVPFAAGGPTDIISRIVGDPLGRILKQQVVIENVTGAGGTVGVTRAKNATPDGYTLLMGNLGTQAASVGLYPKLAYDPRTDFEPIINTAGTPMLVVAKKDLPVKDFKEFIEYVKKNAEKLNYGTGGVGATSHLTCLFLDSILGVQPTHVPFRGSGPALNALLTGSVDYVCDQTVGVVPTIQAGQVNGLVVATPERLAVVPNVPTSKEQGLPEFQAVGWNALFAPKGTPKDIVEKVNAAMREVLKDETTRKRLLELGGEIPPPAEQTPAALGEHVRKEIDKWVPVIKKAGVTVQ